jgi:hypothetical protein
MKVEKQYTKEEIMQEFATLTPTKKVIILTKALELSLARRAGTKEYAIANSMGYIYQDDGTYIK